MRRDRKLAAITLSTKPPWIEHQCYCLAHYNHGKAALKTLGIGGLARPLPSLRQCRAS